MSRYQNYKVVIADAKLQINGRMLLRGWKWLKGRMVPSTCEWSLSVEGNPTRKSPYS